MSTEKKRKAGIGRFGWAPVLMALPFAAALIYAALRWGPTLRDLIDVAVKMVVIA